jgi:hypothetical protein
MLKGFYICWHKIISLDKYCVYINFMDDRYKLAILRLPENAYYLWIKYLDETYRREHVI